MHLKKEPHYGSGEAVKVEAGLAYHEVCWLAEQKEDSDGDVDVVGDVAAAGD